MHWTQFFGGLLNFFDGEQQHPDIFANTSEGSNFLPFWILALPVTLLGLCKSKRSAERESSPAVVGALALFLLGLSVYAVTGYPAWLASITGLGFTTENRSVLALGVAGMLLLFVSLRRDHREWLSMPWRCALLAAVAIAVLAYLFWNRTWNPKYLDVARSLSLGGIAVGLAAGYLFLAPRIFAMVLAAVLLWNNFLVNPVAQGLPALLESTAMRRIEKIHQGRSERRLGRIRAEHAPAIRHRHRRAGPERGQGCAPAAVARANRSDGKEPRYLQSLCLHRFSTPAPR